HTEEIAREHYWQVSDTDLDAAIVKLGSPELAQKLTHDDGLKGPETSVDGSKASCPETTIPQVSLGFDAIFQLLSEASLFDLMGDTELESVTSTMSSNSEMTTFYSFSMEKSRMINFRIVRK
ncbi:MAG: hypothetical protein KDA72_11680, partial [Planctomycetales bacterium]|nr:hypothetical protein [Planctomycetales bacterium]